LGVNGKEREKGRKAKSHKGLMAKYRLWKTFLDCRGRKEKKQKKGQKKSPDLRGLAFLNF
jgi:hypothetical protein